MIEVRVKVRVGAGSYFACFAVRLFADVLNDVAIFLEIIAPVFQQYFRLIVCTAGVSKVRRTFTYCPPSWF